MDLADARMVAEAMLKYYKLSGWTVVFDNCKTRAGICDYDKKQIGLSRDTTLRHSDDQVIATVRHEVAHALCPGEGHSKVWQAMDRSMGGSGERCYVDPEARNNARYAGVCATHGRLHGWYRKPRVQFICAHCKTILKVVDTQPRKARGRT